MNALEHFVVSILGLGSSLQARRTETMVDGLPCAASFRLSYILHMVCSAGIALHKLCIVCGCVFLHVFVCICCFILLFEQVLCTHVFCFGFIVFLNYFETLDCFFLLFSFVFLNVFGCTALRVHPAVTRLTVHRRPYVVFGDRGCSNLKFSKSVNSFGPTVFFRMLFRLWLSIGRTKSQNEFATKELRWTKGWFHGTDNFEHRTFHEMLTLVTS